MFFTAALGIPDSWSIPVTRMLFAENDAVFFFRTVEAYVVLLWSFVFLLKDGNDRIASRSWILSFLLARGLFSLTTTERENPCFFYAELALLAWKAFCFCWWQLLDWKAFCLLITTTRPKSCRAAVFFVLGRRFAAAMILFGSIGRPDDLALIIEGSSLRLYGVGLFSKYNSNAR